MSNFVWVEGHYRTLPNGKKVWVRGYWKKKTQSVSDSWRPISGNTRIKLPKSSPTFSINRLNSVFDDFFSDKKKKKKKKR